MLETFINVADGQQRADFVALATQDSLPMLFYDEAVTLQLAKVVPYHRQEEAAAILLTAEQMLGSLTSDPFDFALAKADVMEAMRR